MKEDQGFSIQPWHMWGSSQTITVPGTVPSQPSGQLARVNFDRPTTWSFLLFVALERQIANPTLDVRFDVILGVGRDNRVVRNFCTLRAAFDVPAWTQSTLAVGPTDPQTGTLVNLLVDRITAHDIQCSATVLNAPPTGAVVTVGSFFAPFSHQREEWFK